MSFRGQIVSQFRHSFAIECIEVLVHSFEKAIEKNTFDLDWEEDQFTAHLVEEFMKPEVVEQGKKISINAQVPYYNYKISSGQIHPKKAKQPDIKCERFHSSTNTPFTYFIEAKNLSENDWNKKKGSKVDASEQRGRYIETGIDNYKSNNYPNGCLVGYVLQGETEKIVIKINNRLKKWSRETEYLTSNQIVNGFPNSFISSHLDSKNNEIAINHIFLQFYS